MNWELYAKQKELVFFCNMYLFHEINIVMHLIKHVSKISYL